MCGVANPYQGLDDELQSPNRGTSRGGVIALSACASGAAEPQAPARPRIGVAFGGGSARGLAHVGIIRWFEEHRIPIDLVAGTSMGGLVGGAFASGMSSDEIARMLEGTDWDEMFGSSSFRYKNVRRKEDARAYPSRIEFGLKQGLALPVALNNGQHGGVPPRADRRRLRAARQLRRAANAVSLPRGRPRHIAIGRARSRLARRGDAGDDVVTRHLSADRSRRSRPGGRRRA